MRTPLRALLLVLIIVCTTQCTSTIKTKLTFNPSEPIRVAVLPFIYVDNDGKMVDSYDGMLALDNVPLLSQELSSPPAVLMRRAAIGSLSKGALDLVPQRLIDVELPHRGFGKADGSFDLMKLYATDPVSLCSDFLDCDAVLFGYVTKWDRSYYGIQSVNTVGVKLKLISARNRSELYIAEGEDTESRGITKGPTGISDLVIEPVKGLDSEIIEDLARSLVKKLTAPLVVDAPTPEGAPPMIFATSHDAPESKLISRKEPLTILAFGSEKVVASFSIGKFVENIPMIERSEGHYVGEYYPLASDSFSEQTITVYLTDRFGRTTSQKISKANVTLK